jgi:multidrug efflux system membrane fusion protein
MSRIWIFLPIFWALASCGPSSTQSNTQSVAKNVLVANALSKDVPVQLYEFGRISSPESVDVKPQGSGRIMEVHFTQGQDVKKGDLLFVIDPRPFQADLDQAQGQLQSDSAQLELNQSNLQRDEKIGTQHFVSQGQSFWLIFSAKTRFTSISTSLKTTLHGSERACLATSSALM